jgi:hypothetical protein
MGGCSCSNRGSQASCSALGPWLVTGTFYCWLSDATAEVFNGNDSLQRQRLPLSPQLLACCTSLCCYLQLPFERGWREGAVKWAFALGKNLLQFAEV